MRISSFLFSRIHAHGKTAISNTNAQKIVLFLTIFHRDRRSNENGREILNSLWFFFPADFSEGGVKKN